MNERPRATNGAPFARPTRLFGRRGKPVHSRSSNRVTGVTSLARRLPIYWRLMRFDRPVGTLLLLWPTLAALWMAHAGLPSPRLLVVFVLGTIVMRAAGCVINDYADRELDAHVARTRDRPLATKQITDIEALLLFAVLLAIALLLVFFLNRQTQWLALAGAGIATLYPFMKRWTYLPQVVLGAAFSWGIVMAFAATGAGLPDGAWLMFIASLLWIVSYDTIYAMVDREDDLRIGIKSTAILFGNADRAMVAVLQVSTIVVLALLGLRLTYGVGYFAGLGVAAGLFVYQQKLIRDRNPARCFAAFRNNVWVGFAVFVGTVIELELPLALPSFGGT
jgi:4-hydroxybenzoate polyprenyltransferase